MDPEANLERFIEAQEESYSIALAEIRQGRKRTHWMWYIFPQIQGLGNSETSRFYAIRDLKEAEAFLKHPILGNRLIQICTELYNQKENNAHIIFGTPDDLKLKSSMTLFSSLPHTDPVFNLVLEKFFHGEKDKKTLQIISETANR